MHIEVCAIVCFPSFEERQCILHSTGEQSHYRSRNSSLEATALHVVWIDRVSFSRRRAVEHTLCHYQCPAVQTSLPPYFSWEKNWLSWQKTNKYLTVAALRFRYKHWKSLNKYRSNFKVRVEWTFVRWCRPWWCGLSMNLRQSIFLTHLYGTYQLWSPLLPSVGHWTSPTVPTQCRYGHMAAVYHRVNRCVSDSSFSHSRSIPFVSSPPGIKQTK